MSTTVDNLNYHTMAQSQNHSDSKPHFTTNLTNSGVIPPLNPNTNATGNATITLLDAVNTMCYKLSGSNVGNVSNIATISSTGGPVDEVVLFHYSPNEGLLTEGSWTLEGNITSADFVDILSGKSMSNLNKMILDGNIHVQAGTVDHPLGEIGVNFKPVL